MHAATTLAVTSQEIAQFILEAVVLLAALALAGAVLFGALGALATHVSAVPRFAREFRGQFVGLLLGGVFVGLTLTALGLNPLVSFAIGVGGAAGFIVLVAE